MRRPFASRGARAAWSLARDAARASSADAKGREQGLALVAAGLEAIDGRPPAHAARARRALAGANVHGFGLEIRQIAAVLEGAVRALDVATERARERLLAGGVATDVAEQIAPIVALEPVLTLARGLLAAVDGRLVAVPSIALEAPYQRAVRCVAQGRVVVEGAVAELLRQTGALDTDTHTTRAKLQSRVHAALHVAR